MLSNFLIGALAFGLLWLLILTVLFWQLLSHYNRLTKGINEKTLKGVLESLLKEGEGVQKALASVVARCATLEKEGFLHIQKIGLLRFNPFKDTGGDQSFIVSILDGKNTGVVISGLHSRVGTRWYAKRVVEGLGVEHELSEDEKKAVEGAKKM